MGEQGIGPACGYSGNRPARVWLHVHAPGWSTAEAQARIAGRSDSWHRRLGFAREVSEILVPNPHKIDGLADVLPANRF